MASQPYPPLLRLQPRRCHQAVVRDIRARDPNIIRPKKDYPGDDPNSSSSSDSSEKSSDHGRNPRTPNSSRGSGKRAQSSRSKKTSSSSSSLSSSSGDPYRKEKKLMRVKGYDSLKIQALPKNAAEARGFRNSIVSSIAKLTNKDEGKVLTWIVITYNSHDEKKLDHSGDYPLLDRLLGHRLLELARGTKFNLDFQRLGNSHAVDSYFGVSSRSIRLTTTRAPR